MVKRKLECMVLILMTVLMTLMLFPEGVSAASAKKKLVKTEKEYNEEGKLTYSRSCKYDKYGNLTYVKITRPLNNWVREEKIKNVYWKKTGILKKVTTTIKESSSSGTIIDTYTKKGILKKSVSSFKGRDTLITTYKNNGKYYISSVTKLEGGQVQTRQKYDRYGCATKTTNYYAGRTEINTEKYTYKKGVRRKCVLTFGDSKRKTTVTYDKHGNINKIEHLFEDGTKLVTTCKNTYDKKGYLSEVKTYSGTKMTKENLIGSTKLTYTKKKY